MRRAGLERSTLVVAGVATLGLIMASLDTTIVNVALDTLSSDLHAPLGTIQWVSTAYLLSLAAVIPLSGWMTERFGSKRTWIASIVLFAVAVVGTRPDGALACRPEQARRGPGFGRSGLGESERRERHAVSLAGSHGYGPDHRTCFWRRAGLERRGA